MVSEIVLILIYLRIYLSREGVVLDKDMGCHTPAMSRGSLHNVQVCLSSCNETRGPSDRRQDHKGKFRGVIRDGKGR